MSPTTYPSSAISVIIYGLRRHPDVELSVAGGTEAILKRNLGDHVSVHVHKYCQDSENVAHGGVVYSEGGRMNV